MAPRVTGIGGVFVTAEDPEALTAWYREHLDVRPLDDSPWGPDDDAPVFPWRRADDPDVPGHTVFAIFPADTEYFRPGTRPYMLNLRVDDLDAVLAALADEGVRIEGDVQGLPFGRFARIVDPEGNPVELWEPAEGF